MRANKQNSEQSKTHQLGNDPEDAELPPSCVRSGRLFCKNKTWKCSWLSHTHSSSRLGCPSIIASVRAPSPLLRVKITTKKLKIWYKCLLCYTKIHILIYNFHQWNVLGVKIWNFEPFQKNFWLVFGLRPQLPAKSYDRLQTSHGGCFLDFILLIESLWRRFLVTVVGAAPRK